MQYVTSLEDIEVRNDREAAWRARRKSGGDEDDDNEDSADEGGEYDEDLAEQARVSYDGWNAAMSLYVIVTLAPSPSCSAHAPGGSRC